MYKKHFTELKYDCHVFVCPYNRGPVKESQIYEKFYYEIFKGLESVNITLDRNGMGTASIGIVVPIPVMDSTGLINTNTQITKILLKYDRENSGESPKIITAEKYLSNRESRIKKYESLGKTHDEAVKAVDDDLKNNHRFVHNKDGEDVIIDTMPHQTDFDQKNTKIQVVAGAPISFLERKNIIGVEEDRKNLSYFPILNNDLNECYFRPMDKIKIFMSNRFQGRDIDDDQITTISDIDGYSQVFEGLITSTHVSYNAGTIRISIEANDLTKWLEISQFNVNPAIASNILDSIFENMGIRYSTTPFANMDINDIVRILIIGNQDKWTPTTKAAYEAAKDKTLFKKEEGTLELPDWKLIHQAILNTTQYRFEKHKKIDQKLLNKYAVKTKEDLTLVDMEAMVIGEGLSDSTPNIILNSEEIKTLQDAPDKIKTDEYFVKAPNLQGAGNFRLLEKGEGIRPGETAGIDTIRLETDFTYDKLWIDPSIPDFTPYVISFNNFELFQHNRRPRLEIIKEITAINELEFYMDSTGILVCKIPDYNLNPGKLLSDVLDSKQDGNNKNDDETKLFKSNDDRFIIKSKDIISYDKGVSDANIHTVCILNGNYQFGISEVAWNCTDIAFDRALAKNFGARIIEKEIPLLSGYKNSSSRKMFAKSFLNRLNATYKTVNLTIPLRPELQIAKTVAIIPAEAESLHVDGMGFNKYIYTFHSKYRGENPTKRDIIGRDELKPILDRIEVGYISSMTHSWVVGGQCNTTLNLTHVRLWPEDFGTLSYKRSNVASDSEVSTEYQIIESEIRAKMEMKKSTYKRYQAGLSNKGYYKGTIDGEVGDGTRNAVNDFIKIYNLKYSTIRFHTGSEFIPLEEVKPGADPFTDGDLLAAFKTEGLF